MVAGVAALTVPLVIHLFHRSRPKHIYWGAMHLLEEALLENKRRLNIENLLLLLIRCLIPTLLALSMARPVFTRFAELLGSGNSSIAIVLDDSYSMAAVNAGRSSYDAAREAISALLDTAGDGSDANVVLAGSGPEVLREQSTYDAVALVRELGETEAVHGRGDWNKALESGFKTLAGMTQPVRDLIWVSDFQKRDFADGAATALNRLGVMREDSTVKPRVVLYPVGERVPNNVAVTSLEYSELLQGVGQPFTVRATVKNFGQKEWPALRVYFRVNEEERDVSEIRLAPREERQVVFTHVFEKPGSQLIEVFADADSLKVDNYRRASVPVWDQLSVLLVNGEPSNEPLKGETDYLALALQPLGGATNLIRATEVSAFQFNPGHLQGHQVVVMANVMNLNEARLNAVKEFVRAGGGLLIFPGNRIQAAWYNDVLAQREGLSPLRYASLEGDNNGTGTRIAAQRYDHAALELFNEAGSGRLSDAQIRIWYQAELASAPGHVPGSVIAQLSGGAPFLAERAYGQGRVLQCVVPCDADWSNLPLRPFFVPLMQRLVTHLATDAIPPRNLRPGQTIAATFDVRETGRPMRLRRPDGREIPVKPERVGPRSMVEYGDTRLPGVYTLKAEPAPDAHFVVQPDPVESELERLSDAELDDLAARLGASVVRSASEFRELDRDRRFGTEVWRELFWAVLVLLFAELALQQWIGRKTI